MEKENFISIEDHELPKVEAPQFNSHVSMAEGIALLSDRVTWLCKYTDMLICKRYKDSLEPYTVRYTGNEIDVLLDAFEKIQMAYNQLTYKIQENAISSLINRKDAKRLIEELKISEKQFKNKKLKQAFISVKRIADKNELVDTVLLAKDLGERGVYDFVGGGKFVAELSTIL